jgi:hypothetical protein
MEKAEKLSLSDGEIQQSAVVHIDPAEEKKVVRKIDRVVLPLMCTVYFFQCKSALPATPWHSLVADIASVTLPRPR